MTAETAPTPVPAPPTAPLFDSRFLSRLERLAILSRRPRTGQMQGERRSPKRGQSVEFSDFRPYTHGDDFRRIDWNAYARLERFFIKLFVEEEDLNIHILLDASQSMDWGEPTKHWYGVRAAGALGYIALAGLDRVSVTVLGGAPGSPTYFSPHRGKAQAHALFSFLQSVQPGGAVQLGAQLIRYGAAGKSPGPLLLFSDLMDPAWADGLRMLAGAGYDVTVLHTLSPDEIAPQVSGDIKLVDSETGQTIEITADAEFLARYQANLEGWQEELRRFCGARNMQYLPVITDLPFEELIFTWLRRQGVVR